MRVTGTSVFAMVAATVSVASFLLVGESMHADTETSRTQKVSMTSIVMTTAVQPVSCSLTCDEGYDYEVG